VEAKVFVQIERGCGMSAQEFWIVIIAVVVWTLFWWGHGHHSGISVGRDREHQSAHSEGRRIGYREGYREGWYRGVIAEAQARKIGDVVVGRRVNHE
jgi:hypothetical protein